MSRADGGSRLGPHNEVLEVSDEAAAAGLT